MESDLDYDYFDPQRAIFSFSIIYGIKLNDPATASTLVTNFIQILTCSTVDIILNRTRVTIYLSNGCFMPHSLLFISYSWPGDFSFCAINVYPIVKDYVVRCLHNLSCIYEWMIAFGARHRHILVHGQILRSSQRDFLVALEELGLIRGSADWIFSVMILPFHDNQ